MNSKPSSLQGLAFDRESVRTIDEDGRLHVEVTNISKAAVNGYLGSEIPNFEELGLEANKIYNLLRDPEELEKSVATFNNLPLLNDHFPVSADDPRPGMVIGSTGTDAEFKAPYLRNSLVVWTADAIEAINSGDQRELSSAYRYVPDMTPGTYEGEPFHGVMRQIRGSHVALVAKGRAGPDVVVGDSQLEKANTMSKKALSRKATLAKGALLAVLRPMMAADAKLDLNSVLQSVNHANWAKSKADIAAAIKTKLAKDADISDVVKLLDSLDGEDPDAVAAQDDEAVEAAKKAALSKDADPVEEVLELLKGKLSDEDHAACCSKLAGLKKPAAPAAVDEPLAGATKLAVKPEDEGKEPPITKAAMDAAIAAATKATEDKTVARMQAAAEAVDVIKPYVGKLAVAQDSAEGVYKAALETMGVTTKDLHPSAYRAVLEAQPKPGAEKPRLAADHARPQGFADRFPGATIRKV